MSADCKPELPITVTGIEIQKNNTMRYSLFSEQGFIIGVSEAVLIGQKIEKGTILTEKLYAAITEGESYEQIKNYLFDLLSRRDHASTELRQKATKKGFEATVTEQIITELEKKGYVNNKMFALKFARDKFNLRHWGANKIRNELIRKGISTTDIETAIADCFTEDTALEALARLTAKKKPALLRCAPEKRKNKLFGYLFQKGYDTNVILQNIDKLLEIVRE